MIRTTIGPTTQVGRDPVFYVRPHDTMTKFDASQIKWRKPWVAVPPDHAPKLAAELHCEMCAGHVLFGRSVMAVGHRQDCDDFLFYLGDISPQFAVVHLTFQRETRPSWPNTSLFDSLAAWTEQCMIPDAQEFCS